MTAQSADAHTTGAVTPVDLLIHEPIGELLLTLEERKLVVAPSRAFVHNLAERMARAEASVRGRSGVVDRWVVRARGKAESGLERFFGEFAIEDCDVALVETRLRLRIGKVRTSFGPQAFDLKRAEDFVRQFDRAKATE